MGAPRAAVTSSTPSDACVDITMMPFFALAARATATSPSGWNERRAPIGQKKIGDAARVPNTSVLKST